MTKVDIIAIKTKDDFGQETLGCSLRINDDTATLADFLEALDLFSQDYLADCRGCDGCCYERAPLIAADIPALAALLPASDYPAHAVCTVFAELIIDKRGTADIYLRRGYNSGCCLLDQGNKICSAHMSRAFVCRSHFCIPRSLPFENFREEIVNDGENALIRLLIAEEENGAPALGKQKLKTLLNPEDFPPNPQSGKQSYADISLRACLSTDLFEKIKKEGR